MILIRLAPSPEFTGNLAPNTGLQKATYLAKGRTIKKSWVSKILYDNLPYKLKVK